ncbi:hypothetical protein B484DRAFT_26876, partial [Ochromonadaceae sp. CCMP2298]
MDATPSSLKDVFLEAVRLDALRGALMREIAVTRNRRMSTAGPPGARIGSPEARGMGSADVEDKIKKMRAAVTNHLSIVPELMEEVQGRVFSNITRMFEMAQEFPANLVMSFEIVEMWQEYNGRRKGTGKTRGPEQVDLYAIVDDILRGGLEEKVRVCFVCMCVYMCVCVFLCMRLRLRLRASVCVPLRLYLWASA